MAPVYNYDTICYKYMKKSLVKFSAIFFAFLLLAGCGEPTGPGKYAEVAKCLTSKNVIMYGAYWCPHCQTQKEKFGGDFQFVHYQECDPKGENGDKAVCLEAGVTSYPTWKFPGQGDLVGEQQISTLAKLANCHDKLPAEELQKLKEDEKAAQTPSPATAPTTPTTSGEAKPTTTVTATPGFVESTTTSK